MSQYSLQRRAMLGGPLWFLGLGAVSRSVSAAVQFDVLRNRKIRAIIGGKPGAGTDVMGRAFFAALGRLLPDTSINIQTISGGAGAAALEELFQAKGDMIAVSIFGNGPIYSELLLAERLPFDTSKLNWLGSIGDGRRLVVVSKTLQVKTFAELAALDTTLIAPSSGAGSPNHIETLLLNSIAGLNLKVVPGFDDGQIDTMLMSGDAQVRLAGSFQIAPLLASGDAVAVLRMGDGAYPASLQSLPTLSDVARPNAPANVVYLLESLNKLGRPFAAAPGTDPAVVQALREAFLKAIEDPDFKNLMSAEGFVGGSTPGGEMASMMASLFDNAALSAAVKGEYDCGKQRSDEPTAVCP